MEQFLSETLVPVEAALGAFNELYSKYKYMETSFERSKNIYKSKIPDIEQTLEMIKLMLAKKDEEETMLTNYGLSDTLYSTAEVKLLFFVICSFSITDLTIPTGGSRCWSGISMDWSWNDGGVYLRRGVGVA